MKQLPSLRRRVIWKKENNMKINRDKKYIIFENDEDFVGWCVDPTLKIHKDGDIISSYFDFTPQYNEWVKSGYKFIIADKKSQIYKHQAVTVNVLTRKVQNLKAFYGREFL